VPDLSTALRNVSLTMTAGGPSAIACVWAMSVAVVGVFGHGTQAQSALEILGSGGAFVFAGLVASGAFRT
jgi:hypothetical protein